MNTVNTSQGAISFTVIDYFYRFVTVIDYFYRFSFFKFKVCCDANGFFLPLYVLFQIKNLYHNWLSEGPDGCVFNCGESGWMETPHLYEWFSVVFFKTRE